MSLVEFAEDELNMLLKDCKDSESLKMQKCINEDILNIIKLFSEQHHSGFSAKYSLNILKRLLDYKPLSAITDNPDEWLELNYDNDINYQCKRCPQLFKDSEGRVYNTSGKLFSEDNGHTWFNNKNSRVYVELPYNVPDSPEYIIIDNSIERETILNRIKYCLQKMTIGQLDVDDVNEDTIISDYLTEDLIDKLFEELKQYYKDEEINIQTKYLQNDELYIWQIINLFLDVGGESDED